jgi:hypothetical protein
VAEMNSFEVTIIDKDGQEHEFIMESHNEPTDRDAELECAERCIKFSSIQKIVWINPLSAEYLANPF